MQTNLYYREGSSDKVYQVEVAPSGGLFLVNFAFGRRGTTLTTGSKTPVPVPEARAKEIFAKLVREKKAKGYTEGEAGTPYHHSAEAGRVTEYRPQLLNPIDAKEIDTFLGDPNWCLQEKKDGRQLLIQKVGAAIQGINRRGLAIGLPAALEQQIGRIPHDFVIDGEAMGDTFHAFDLLAHNGENVRPQPYQERLNALELLIWDGHVDGALTVPTFYGDAKKRRAFADFQRRNTEGVVFKHLAAAYTPGRPNSGGPALKFKFITSASCLVSAVSSNKRSVSLVLLEGSEQRAVGNLAIPPNQSIPGIGDILEVQYLYAFRPSNALFQPVFLRIRDDLTAADCTLAQLKFKREETDDDDQ